MSANGGIQSDNKFVNSTVHAVGTFVDCNFVNSPINCSGSVIFIDCKFVNSPIRDDGLCIVVFTDCQLINVPIRCNFSEFTFVDCNLVNSPVHCAAIGRVTFNNDCNLVNSPKYGSGTYIVGNDHPSAQSATTRPLVSPTGNVSDDVRIVFGDATDYVSDASDVSDIIIFNDDEFHQVNIQENTEDNNKNDDDKEVSKIIEKCDNAAPSVDNAAPSVDNAAPSVDNAAPSVDNAAPSVDNAAPSDRQTKRKHDNDCEKTSNKNKHDDNKASRIDDNAGAVNVKVFLHGKNSKTTITALTADKDSTILDVKSIIEKVDHIPIHFQGEFRSKQLDLPLPDSCVLGELYENSGLPTLEFDCYCAVDVI